MPTQVSVEKLMRETKRFEESTPSTSLPTLSVGISPKSATLRRNAFSCKHDHNKLNHAPSSRQAPNTLAHLTELAERKHDVR
jgi:hypothetical protein